MKEYVIGVICTASIIALGAALSYRKDDKAIRAAFSIILISSVILPIAPIFRELLKEGDHSLPPIGEYGDEYEQVAKDSLELGIKKAIAERFGLNEDELSVTVDGFVFEEMSFDEARVVLHGAAAFADITALERYLKKNFSESEIKVEIG